MRINLATQKLGHSDGLGEVKPGEEFQLQHALAPLKLVCRALWVWGLEVFVVRGAFVTSREGFGS